MIINRNYIIQPYDIRETFKGTLLEKLSDTMYLFDNVTKLEITRTPNQTIINPTTRYGRRIFNTRDYFELQQDGKKRKRRKSKKRKSKKRKSRKRKSRKRKSRKRKSV
jgi:hypothetical protein